MSTFTMPLPVDSGHRAQVTDEARELAAALHEFLTLPKPGTGGWPAHDTLAARRANIAAATLRVMAGGGASIATVRSVLADAAVSTPVTYETAGEEL